MPNRVQRLSTFLSWTCVMIAAVLVTALIIDRALPVLADPWPREYDSFFYLQEWRERLANNPGYYRSFSAFFAFTSACGSIFGLDEILLYDFVLLGAYVLFLSGIGTIAYCCSGPAVAALLLYAASAADIVWRVHDTFLRQSVAVALVVCGIALLQPKISERRIVLRLFACCLILLGASFHAFAAIVASAVLLVCCVRLPRRFIAPLGLLLLVVGAVAVAPYWLRLSTDLVPNLSQMWTIGVQRSWLSAREGMEIALLVQAAALLVPIAAFYFRRSWLLFPLILLTAVLLLPLWRAESTAQFRFVVNGVILCLLIAAYLGSVVPRSIAQLFSLLLAIAITMALAKAPISNRFVGPLVAPEALESQRSGLKEWLGNRACIRAPHGIGFRLTYFLNVRAGMRKLSDPKCEHYEIQLIGDAPQYCGRLSDFSTTPETDCLLLERGAVIRRVTPRAALLPPGAPGA